MAYIDNVNKVLNIQPEAAPTRVRLSQNENGRNLYFTLAGNENPIPSGVTVTISGTKPDGTVYSGTGSISNDVVLIPETVQLTAVAGVWDAKVKITSGGNTVATGRIRFLIDADTVAPGSVPSSSVLEGLVEQAQQYAETARQEAYGSPLTAALASDMTDKTRVYVYTGSESGKTAGHWYYWNGSAWTDGGVYNSTAVQTDKTLSLMDVPADGKAVGDAIATDKTLTISDAPADALVVGEKLALIKEMIAGVEVTSTATKAYAVGDLVIVGDVFYKMTKAITSGTQISSTNAQKTTIADVLEYEITDLKSKLYERIGDLDSEQTAIKGMIAGIESAYTATKNYNVGDLLIVESSLFKATAAIATGSQINASNVAPTTIASAIADLKGDLNDSINSITNTTRNKLIFKSQNVSHNGIIGVTNAPSHLKLTGTSTGANATCSFKLFKPIKVEAGKSYVLSFDIDTSTIKKPIIYLFSGDTRIAYATVSSVRSYIQFAISNDADLDIIKFRYSNSGTTADFEANLQFEEGTIPTTYIPPLSANDILLNERISNIEEDSENYVEKSELFVHTNLINPDEINMNLRIASNGVIGASGENYAGTGMIPVEEGEMYTFQGTAMFELGGYFGEGAEMVSGEQAISMIEFFTPVSGVGKAFQVPTGLGIKLVTLVLRSPHGEITGTYQLEKGEMATDIVPYSVYFIDPSLIKNSGGGGSSDVNGIDLLPKPSYNSLDIEKIASFREHWAKKDRDLMVVGTGTSLTARGSEHCTTRADATSRPPLLDSNNFASLIWDRIKWDGQYYRRYDYGDFFTETGTFTTSNSNANWDDTNFRNGLTRYAEGAASVSYTVPADAWQTNFIYRSEVDGSESVSVSVAEGNGVLKVWNGTAWVEANGYTFSMKETSVILPTVSVPNPLTNEDNSDVTLTDYQVSGNTTFQKRLKMKAVTRSATKTITISSSSGRLLYWGVEWSVREFMITYVNSARGSHNMTVTSDRALQHFQDNEIWSFKPDLMFTENPIHNSGGSGQAVGFAAYYSSYWRNVTYDFFFNANNPVSLISRAAVNGIDTTSLEWVIFNTSISWNFHGITDDGTLDIKPDKNGRMITALDAQMMSQDYITESNKAVSINACKYWVDAGIALFGDLKTATLGSGKDGETFTNEGSHWNNTGSKIMDRCIGGVFDFYN